MGVATLFADSRSLIMCLMQTPLHCRASHFLSHTHTHSERAVVLQGNFGDMKAMLKTKKGGKVCVCVLWCAAARAGEISRETLKE